MHAPRIFRNPIPDTRYAILLLLLTLATSAHAQITAEIAASVGDSCSQYLRALHLNEDANRLYHAVDCGGKMRLIAYDTNLSEVWRHEDIPGSGDYIIGLESTNHDVILAQWSGDTIWVSRYTHGGTPLWSSIVTGAFYGGFKTVPRILVGRNGETYTLSVRDSNDRRKREAMLQRIEPDGSLGWFRSFKPGKQELLAITGMIARNGNIFFFVGSDSSSSNKTNIRGLVLNPTGDVLHDTMQIYDRCCSLNVAEMMPDGGDGALLVLTVWNPNITTQRNVLRVDTAAGTRLEFGVPGDRFYSIHSDSRGGFFIATSIDALGTGINRITVARFDRTKRVWQKEGPNSRPVSSKDTFFIYWAEPVTAVDSTASFYIAGYDRDFQFKMESLDSSGKIRWRTTKTVYPELRTATVRNLNAMRSGSVFLTYGQGTYRNGDPPINLLVKYRPAIPSAVPDKESSAATFATIADVSQIAPNPTRDAATLRCTLNRSATVTITLHDAAGRRIAVILDERKESGEFHVDLDVRTLDLPAGAYFVRILAGGDSRTVSFVVE